MLPHTTLIQQACVLKAPRRDIQKFRQQKGARLTVCAPARNNLLWPSLICVLMRNSCCVVSACVCLSAYQIVLCCLFMAQRRLELALCMPECMPDCSLLLVHGPMTLRTSIVSKLHCATAQPVLCQLSFVQLEHAQCVALMCGMSMLQPRGAVWVVRATAERRPGCATATVAARRTWRQVKHTGCC